MHRIRRRTTQKVWMSACISILFWERTTYIEAQNPWYYRGLAILRVAIIYHNSVLYQ